MKRLLLFLLVACATNLQAKNYYVSASGNDTNDGLTTSTPWKTIAKVNSFIFAANDNILFQRGDAFYGSIIINRNNLSIDAYGTGAAPVISGFTQLTGWTLKSTGIYEISAPTVKNNVNMVTLNGVPQEVGRFPNSDDANGGYLTCTSFSGNTQFTSTGLSGTNWTGAEIVARLRGYVVERNKITAQSGSTIRYTQTLTTINPRNAVTPAPTTPPGAGFGLFVQRDIRTLDKMGEWYFDPTTKVMSMYFGGTNPSSSIIKVSTLDTLINIGNHTNISINNLSLDGANLIAVYFSDGSNITVKNCTINNSGAKAILGWFSFNTLIDNNNINNSLCGGIDVRGPANPTIISNNIVKNSGMFKGMSSFYDPADCHGIFLGVGNGGTIRKNIVDSTGYIGIHYEGNGVTIDSNYVNYFGATRNDGGGIYAFNNYTSNSIIKNNIITNGQNASVGTHENNGSQGIYMDGGQGGVSITDNTIANLTGSDGSTWGLFFNSPKNISARNNTVYNCPGGWYVGRQYDQSMTGFILSQNVFYQIAANQVIMQHTHNGLNTTANYTVSNIQQSLQGLGLIDSNYYNMIQATPFSWYYAANFGGGFTFPAPVNFSTWKSYTNLDAKTISSNNSTQIFQFNASSSPVVYNFAGLSKKDVRGTVYNNSATVLPFSSLILIPNGTSSNFPPIANAGTNQTITLPINAATLSGSGTDSDGTISSYAWVKIAGPTTGTIVNATAATTTVNNLIQGVYQFQLTVTDNLGATGKDTIQVTVNAAGNIAPSANAGADKSITLPNNSTSLTGSGNDADGTISSYEWVKISGPATGTIVNPTTATTTVNNLMQGVYLFQLTVTDNWGATGKDTIQVNVNPQFFINQPPVINAGNDINIVLPLNNVSLNAIANDPDGTIVSYSWAIVSGAIGFSNSTPYLSQTTIGNLFQGIYIVQLTVVDNNGGITKDSLTITVSSPRLSNTSGNNSSNQFNVYPNPVKDVANISIKTINRNTKISISVTDLTGRVVKVQDLVTMESTTTLKLDISDLTNSFYIITLRFDDGEIISTKILKNSSN